MLFRELRKVFEIEVIFRVPEALSPYVFVGVGGLVRMNAEPLSDLVPGLMTLFSGGLFGLVLGSADPVYAGHPEKCLDLTFRASFHVLP